VNGWFLTGRME